MKTTQTTKTKSAAALNKAEQAKRLAAKGKPQTIAAPVAVSKPQAAQKAAAVPKAKGRTLYAFSMGNGDGTSLFGRMFYFALYELQGVGDGKAASFKAGKPFKFYPGFNTSYFRTKQVIERTPDGAAWQFTTAGANMLSAYPIPQDAHKQYEAIKAAIVSGKPKDTGRDNQKLFQFTV